MGAIQSAEISQSLNIEAMAASIGTAGMRIKELLVGLTGFGMVRKPITRAGSGHPLEITPRIQRALKR